MTRWIEAALWRWLDFARRHRVAVIAVWALLAAIGLALASRHLSVNTDASGMISAETAFRADHRALEAAFPEFDNQILVIVRAETADAADIVAGKLAARMRARPDVVNTLFAPAVEPFFQSHGLLYLEVEALEDLLARLNRAAPLIERLSGETSLAALFDALARAAEFEDRQPGDAETIATVYEGVAGVIEARLDGAPRRLSWQALFTDSVAPPYQRRITLQPVLDYSRLRPAREVVSAIRAEAEAIRAKTGIRADIGITGNPVLRSDELESVSTGIGWALLASFVMVGLLLVWALRSILLAGFVLLSILVSILITAGLAAVTFGALNLVSIAFAVLMVGLGADFAIHLLLHARVSQRRGLSTRAALYRTARDIGAALALTAPSTALAFIAFAPTDFVGMTQLGFIAGGGVLIAFLVATSLLPAAFALLPSRGQRTIRPQRPLLSANVRRGAAWGLIGLGLAALFTLPWARFDADPMSLRDPDAGSVQAFNQLFEDPATAPYRLSVLTESPEMAEQLAARLGDLSMVDQASTLLSFVPDDQEKKLEIIDFASIGLGFALDGEQGGRPIEPDPAGRLMAALQERDTPAATTLRGALARYRDRLADDPGLAERVGEDLLVYWPHERERLRQQIRASAITLSDLPAGITSRYVSDNGDWRVEIVPGGDVRDAETRARFVEAVTDLAPNASGPARNVHASAEIIRESMIQAVLVALGLVSLLLYLVLRDVRLILIILAPLVMAAALTTATGLFFNLPYNFANVIVLPLLVGIGVDSGIHLALRGAQQSDAHAIYDSATPRAVFFSALTTIASFGTLAISPHQGTASMGALLTIAIAWTLACTVLVLPLLMDLFSRKGDRYAAVDAQNAP